jgi:hypothetical protein
MNWYNVHYELHYLMGTSSNISAIKPKPEMILGDNEQEAIARFTAQWRRKKKPQNIKAVFKETLENYLKTEAEYQPKEIEWDPSV